jgi:hypothetical protein
MLPDPLQHADRILDERGRDIPVIAQIPGQYWLVDHWNSRGKPCRFFCRAVNISERAIALAAPVIGTPGKRVIAHIDQLGRIEGTIIHVLDGGFVMNIAARTEERRKLVEKFDSIRRPQYIEIPERRAFGRFVPVTPYSTLALANGMSRNCLVIDLSEAGAQISADVEPAVGTVLAVGTLVGRVIRRLRGGFAVKFVEVQSWDTVEARVLMLEGQPVPPLRGQIDSQAWPVIAGRVG